MLIYYKDGILFKNVVLCASFFKRLKGLMLKRTLPPKTAYLFYPGGSIHTFFMRFEIYVIFLNRKKQILKVEKAAVNKIIKAPKTTRYVIETKDEVTIKEGECLNFDIN